MSSRPRRLPGSTALALAGFLAGCSQAPPATTPEPGAGQAVAPLEPMPAAAEPAPAEAETERITEAPRPPERRTPEPAPDATVVVVGEREPQPRTLWEAAVAAREQVARSPRSRISVTDENLHEFQDAGLTVASPRAEPARGDGGGEGSDGAAGGEEYWRSRVLDLRLRLRAAVDELAELAGRAAALRRSFYAEDDPYVRDAEIKPAWDRALDRTGEVRREILGLYRELEETLEEGRRAGALPGWLREGIELEPEPEELPEPRPASHEPGEPEVIEIEEPPAVPR